MNGGAARTTTGSVTGHLPPHTHIWGPIYKIALRNIVSYFTNTISDDTVLHVNLPHEKLSSPCKMFLKLDVRRKLNVTGIIVISKIIVRLS